MRTPYKHSALFCRVLFLLLTLHRKQNNMIDKHFNRIEATLDNIYIPQYGTKSSFNEQYNGYVKCKLIHSINESLIFADQIFVPNNEKEFHWIQPLTFLANLLCEDKENDIIHCRFHVDISSGNTLRIDFFDKDWVCNFDDDSSLFKCVINGPKHILEYATGTGYFHDNVPYLKLFHHTTLSSKSLILDSKIFKPSKWNIQGTKSLTNIYYAYFTCLDRIEKNADLMQIAMASNGSISLLVDNINLPQILTPKDIEKYKDYILNLKVYRENTCNRTATIEFFVNATLLSPKHLWKHLPKDEFVYYEICMPFIYRIGIKPNSTIALDRMIINKQKDMKTFAYQVVGLATEIKGLAAPFDEEDTEYLFKIEPLDRNLNILKFWFEHTNSDQFSNKSIKMQEFDKSE